MQSIQTVKTQSVKLKFRVRIPASPLTTSRSLMAEHLSLIRFPNLDGSSRPLHVKLTNTACQAGDSGSIPDVGSWITSKPISNIPYVTVQKSCYKGDKNMFRLKRKHGYLTNFMGPWQTSNAPSF